MYAVSIPFILGTTRLLGSWYGILLELVLLSMIAIRALKEEHMLLRELEGYDVYMTQVRYRFVPHVW
jgi:protein-S-isoprenylcysteine O-methyltransferase Ste14